MCGLESLLRYKATRAPLTSLKTIRTGHTGLNPDTRTVKAQQRLKAIFVTYLGTVGHYHHQHSIIVKMKYENKNLFTCIH